jgi:hypothetical protein
MVKRARARGRSGRWLWLPRFFTGARPAVLAGARLMRSSNRGRRGGGGRGWKLLHIEAIHAATVPIDDRDREH